MEYLRTVAQRGADTHALIKSQEATIDRERCDRAYGGLSANDAPNVDTYDNREEWFDQVKEFFVDSCVSGKPKPVPGDPVPSESAGTATPSGSVPAPEASPSA
ncbi:hypothetical protein [Micromonospora sp. DH14]|uniref:hypothetical protein n=1 Tax=Micromonospora sp. DH14 TaxID=3040120 RepID=UPI0024417086|nr:hypothetical protein [Micromonospora sp. DH14]MDG9677753.1 hypothetical protein [Micromonospora sp. DH14]